MSDVRVHRIEVHPRPGRPDARGDGVRAEAVSLGLAVPERIECASVYLIEGAIDESATRRIADELLADPVTQVAVVGSEPPRGSALIEVHPQSGVMDPDAEAVELAIRSLVGCEVQVRTGVRYDLFGPDRDAAQQLAARSLANTVIHDIHETCYHPEHFPVAPSLPFEVASVELDGLDDAALQRLSREAHLFLSLDEMKAIQQTYRDLGRAPREIELETLAQTWSEHCVHKTLKAKIRYDGTLPAAPNGAARPGISELEDGALFIDNLLRSTVAAATHETMADGID